MAWRIEARQGGVVDGWGAIELIDRVFVVLSLLFYYYRIYVKHTRIAELDCMALT